METHSADDNPQQQQQKRVLSHMMGFPKSASVESLLSEEDYTKKIALQENHIDEYLDKAHGNVENIFKRIAQFGFLMLSSLGVVYGDLATSPLYTFTAIFKKTPSETIVLGVVSLILYSVLSVVTIKYIIFILSATNKGEGGIFALAALLPDVQKGKIRCGNFLHILKWSAIYLAIIGAAFVLGDGIITPPISVLSSLEGLKAQSAALEPLVVPLAIIILLALFFLQRFGTARVGLLFGPIMLLWCATIAALGIYNITLNYRSLLAFNPVYIIHFFSEAGFLDGVKMFGGVVLSLTGCEAMYADLGHFGAGPIRASWLLIVFPAVSLSYLGQASGLLTNPSQWTSPFFLSCPKPVFWPVLILATGATIIASQALITGAFSLVSQAINLGYFPPIKIYFTNKKIEGQIYIPIINYLLAVMAIALVAIFKTSEALADAFGLAVCGVLIVTTILYVAVMLLSWKVHPIIRILIAIPFTVIYMPIQIAFFGANAIKFLTGGWIPFAIGVVASVVMVVWTWGIKNVKHVLKTKETITYDKFFAKLISQRCNVVPGIGVFLTESSEGVPGYMCKLIDKVNSIPEVIFLLQIKGYRVPVVDEQRKVTITRLEGNVFRMVVRYGFFEKKLPVLGLVKMTIQCHLSHLSLQQLLATKSTVEKCTAIEMIEHTLPDQKPDQTPHAIEKLPEGESTNPNQQPQQINHRSPVLRSAEPTTTIPPQESRLSQELKIAHGAIATSSNDVKQLSPELKKPKQQDRPSEKSQEMQVPSSSSSSPQSTTPDSINIPIPTQMNKEPEASGCKEKKDGNWCQMVAHKAKKWWVGEENCEEADSSVQFFLRRTHLKTNQQNWFWRRYLVWFFILLFRNARNPGVHLLKVHHDNVIEIGSVIKM